MRRLALSLLASFLLAACSPTVILLTREPQATATKVPTPGPTPTEVPTLMPGSKLGVGPGALRDVTVTVWHGLDGESGSLFAQMAAEFALTNTWGIKVDVLPQKNMQQLADSVDSALRSPEHP